MTALVSFDRVFEVLDLKPLIAERPGAKPLAAAAGSAGLAAPAVQFDHVRVPVPGRGRGVAGLA